MNHASVLALILLFSVATEIPASGAPASVKISQSDFVWRGTDGSPPQVTNYSSWGSVDLSYENTGAPQYFNLSIGDVWILRNRVAPAFGAVGSDSHIRFNFDLGNVTGIHVPTIEYGFQVSSVALLAHPTSNFSATLQSGTYNGGGGSGDGGVAPPPAPPAPPKPDFLPGIYPGEIVDGGEHRDFPNQESAWNGCVPTAVSNSLSFLQRDHRSIIFDDDISVALFYDLFDTTEEGGTRGLWFNKKDEYVNLMGWNIRTKIVYKFKDALEEIKKGSNVEITMRDNVKNGDGYYDGHTASINSMYLKDSGKYEISVSHDIEQGDEGGTITESGEWDPVTRRISGIPWFQDRLLVGFVVESVIPEPHVWYLFIAGFGVIGFALRRRRYVLGHVDKGHPQFD